ncbi:MAG TPA: PQQ-binding-like beta-propeller repeat protein [Terriglobia bacterium]|nr:PQQ-binding-like beta-propeller repeat protein [Terriglobia bacterium]
MESEKKDLIRRIRGLLALSAACVVLFASAGSGEDWPKYRRDLSNTGLSSETGINSSNVNSLRVKWQFKTGGAVSASPAVATVNGTSIAYIGAWNGTFYALNGLTGQKIWSFQIDPVQNCNQDSCTRIGSSPAVSNSIVYFGASNGYLYALNASTGALVWKVQVGDPNQGYEVWSSPSVNGSMVYFGVASHDDSPCVVGHVQARSASTGAIIWDFTTINQATCPSGTCVGGGVWASPAIDRNNNVLYVGTGNPGSTCTPSTQNATQYPDSILALNASTGGLLNYFQAIPNDKGDFDFGSSPLLHDTAIYNYECVKGARVFQHWVTEASKDGSMYTFERGAGGLEVDTEAIMSTDGSLLTASPALFNSLTETNCGGLTQNFSLNDIYVPTYGGDLFDFTQNYPGEYPDGVRKNWEVTIGSPLYSAPAVIQDLVFFGGNDSYLHAVTVGGTPTWLFKTGNNVTSGPAISNGRIYFGSFDDNVYCLSPNGQ